MKMKPPTTTIPSFLTSASSASAAAKPVPMFKRKDSSTPAAAAATSASSSKAKAVRAILRVRPPLANKESPAECLRLDPHNPTIVNLNDHGTWSQYKLDHCLPPTASQDDVFAHVRPMLDDAFGGVSATVFAYGMTGSGKTFTIEGSADSRGVVYRSAQYLFHKAPQVKAARKLAHVEVHMAMFELYMDAIEDLLVISKQSGSGSGVGSARVGVPNKPKGIGNRVGGSGSGHEDGLLGAIRAKLVADTCHEYRQVEMRHVVDYDQFVALYQRGLKSRAVGATNLNAKSSRSHLFVQLVLVSRSAHPSGAITFAKVNLVDLAGSENNKKTGNKGLQMDESKAINSSLFALDKVVTALNRPKRGHVPYGDSKLTKILKDSLGGHAQALIIANAGPSADCARETKATLAFATKSVQIVNEPVANTLLVAPPPPPPPTAPPSRKRAAPVDPTHDDDEDGDAASLGPAHKRQRTDPDPALDAIKKELANVTAKLELLFAAATQPPPPPPVPAQPFATPARRAPLMPTAPAHTPGTMALLSADLLRLAQDHVRNGNLKMAAVYFGNVLKDSRVDDRVRKVCKQAIDACNSGAKHLLDAVKGESASGSDAKLSRIKKGKVPASASGGMAKVSTVPLTPRSRSRAETLARANQVLAKYRSTPLPKVSSGLAAAPPLSLTIPDSPLGPAPSSPTASKTSGSRGHGKKKAKASGTLPDIVMSAQASDYLLQMVNCGDPAKIAARFPGFGIHGKAKQIVDHARACGGIASAKDLFNIYGFAEKTVMSMVDTARAAVGEVKVVERSSGAAAVLPVESSIAATVLPVVEKENAVGEQPSKRVATKNRDGEKKPTIVVVIDD
ncbi:P-loop containing nucleoside triphosphate hydrolase protein [Catenaria anguillulae PL171]|uniref:Kinesin-like protein n=1 Tax=Catenaria anguillulae PL171 TaxID=765915 RepID=A0A1Y2HUV8_9FUNG|nr:P-loop containing nucleoside triphosphate hydrolase protein [Catenaria anguillulae PL171]